MPKSVIRYKWTYHSSWFCIFIIYCQAIVYKCIPSHCAAWYQCTFSVTMTLKWSPLFRLNFEIQIFIQILFHPPQCVLYAPPGRSMLSPSRFLTSHDDVIKWKDFPRYWPFVRGIHRSPVNFPHKGQWRGALMFSLICVWINGWVNNREAGDLRRYRAHYDVIVIPHGVLQQTEP